MRLFFGMEVFCPWPERLPEGRVLLESDRHLTLAFLGESSMPDLSSFPKPPFSIGLAGIFDKPLVLTHVVAWHIHWVEEDLMEYQKELAHWLHLEGTFLSHVTLARKPCDEGDWEKSFESLPLYVKNINLYESLGNSRYKIVWQYPMQSPFDELAHTADLAFRVRGDLFLHAQLALAFYFPPLVRYFDFRELKDPDEVIFSLNAIVARADSEVGCPFKAVSFHGTQADEWEMIVDV